MYALFDQYKYVFLMFFDKSRQYVFSSPNVNLSKLYHKIYA